MDKNTFNALLIEALTENLTLDVKSQSYGNWMDGEYHESHELTIKICFDGKFVCEETVTL